MNTLISRETKRGPQPGTGSPKQAMANATAAWTVVPEWLVILAEACDRTSQSHVAKKLGYSGSVISSVISNTYKGSFEAVEKAVRGALMAETLDCPELGEIRKDHCLAHQKKARTFSTSSALRVRMQKACRGGCVHSRLGGQDHA